MSEHAVPNYDSARRGVRFIEELQELVRYRHLLFQLVKRNVTSRYKRSVLGIGWTLLDPLLTMLVMAIVYSALFTRKIEAFPVFILSGLVVWNFFSQASSQAMTGFLHSRTLLGRVYMPKSAMGIAAVGTALVNLVCSLALLAIFMVAFERSFTLSLLFLPIALLVVTAFTLGVGLMVSSWAVFFGDMENIYGFVLRLGMYLSGIFYTLDILPDVLRTIIWWIPTYHFINMFRAPIYAGALPPWDTVLYGTIWSLLMFVCGLWIFTRNANAYAYRI